MNQAETHQCFLSTSGGKWRVISQGLQMCEDKGTRDAAMSAARQLKLTPTAVWDGDEGVFKGIVDESMAAAVVGRAAGKALEEIYPFGYGSGDSAP